eukprot:6098000-Pleurochrysis_carterae.AAC.1
MMCQPLVLAHADGFTVMVGANLSHATRRASTLAVAKKWLAGLSCVAGLQAFLVGGYAGRRPEARCRCNASASAPRADRQ